MNEIDMNSKFNIQMFNIQHNLFVKPLSNKLLNFSLNPFFPFFIRDIYSHETYSKKFKQII
jgi:hypothetical protein